MSEADARQENRPADYATVNAVQHGTMNVFQLSAGVVPVRPMSPPWMAPPAQPDWVTRPELTGEVIRLLEANHGLVGLYGAGGFGKTVLATQVCRRPEISQWFSGGLLWTTLGRELTRTDQAARLNDLSAHLSGQRPAYADPEQAGFHLGRLLDGLNGPALLVIDDAWHATDLEPYLSGGARCRRLVTTRDQRIVSEHQGVRVDQFTAGLARTVLIRGVPDLPTHAVRTLTQLTGRWPLLLTLTNRALRRSSTHGSTSAEAAARICTRLAEGGPGALDVSNAHRRQEAVAATVEASLSLLSPADRERFLLLAIFPADHHIPGTLLDLLWADAGDNNNAVSHGVDAFCETLFDLCLVSNYRSHQRTIQLHSVLRDYLLATVGADLARLNGGLLDQLSALLPGHATASPAAWWTLPAQHYDAFALITHYLAQAERHDELEHLVTDLRWIDLQVRRGGVAAADRDLSHATSPRAGIISDALRRCGHLLGPTTTSHAQTAILLSRLAAVPELIDAVTERTTRLPSPALVNRWPLPDHPQPALLRTLAGHANGIFGVVVGSEGDWLATASWDRTVRIWDTATGQSTASLDGHDAWIADLALAPDNSWLISTDRNDLMQIWDPTTWRRVRSVTGRHRYTTSITPAPNGTWAVTTGLDGAIRLWDTATWHVFSRLHAFDGGGWKTVIAPDGQWFAATGRDGTIRVWTARGDPLTILTGHAGKAWGLAVAPDGTWLASTGADSTVRIWNTSRWTQHVVLTGHTGPVLAVTVAPDGTWLATTGEDQTVRLWETATWSSRALLLGHTNAVNAAATAADGTWLVTVGTDRTARLWNTATTSRTDTTHEDGHLSGVWKVASTHDANGQFATASWDRTIRIWDLYTARTVTVLRGHRQAVYDVALSPHGDWAVSTSSDEDARIWDLPSGHTRAVLTGHRGGAWATAIAPDETWLATTSLDAQVRIWDATTGRLRHTLSGHTGPVTSIVIAPDSSWLATGGIDRTIRIWTPTGKTQRVLAGHRLAIWSLTATPDGTSLLSGGIDGTILRWDLADGADRLLTRPGPDGVWGLAVSTDGRLLAAAAGNTLHIRDSVTGTPVTSMRVDGSLESCTWVGEATICTVGSGGVYVFDLR